MTTLRSSLREYVAGLLETADEIVVTDAAAAFVDSHSGEIAEHMQQVVAGWVADQLRALCSERPEDRGQLTLIPGLPAGIVIAPGVVKPRRRCMWPDLLVGRVERTENITYAEKALVLYDEALDRLRPLMESDLGMTVEDAVKRLRAQEVTS